MPYRPPARNQSRGNVTAPISLRQFCGLQCSAPFYAADCILGHAKIAECEMAVSMLKVNTYLAF